MCKLMKIELSFIIKVILLNIITMSSFFLNSFYIYVLVCFVTCIYSWHRLPYYMELTFLILYILAFRETNLNMIREAELVKLRLMLDDTKKLLKHIKETTETQQTIKQD